MAELWAIVGLVVFRDLLETWQVHNGLRAFKKPPAPRPRKAEGTGDG